MITLSACSESYTITFDSVGGSPVTAIEVEKGEPVALPIPVKEGYIFVGWFDNKEWSGSSIITATQVTGNVELYAMWREDLIEIELEIVREPMEVVTWGFRQYAILDNLNMISIISDPGNGVYIWDDNLINLNNFLNYDERLITWDMTYNNLIILTSEFRILTYGDNKHGQLGNNNFNDAYDRLIDISSSFNFNQDEYPVMVASFSSNMGLLTNKGRIFLWGSVPVNIDPRTNSFYSSEPIDFTDYFKFSNKEEYIKKFGIGSEYLFVTTLNNIYSWGSPGGGGLGTGRPGLHKNGVVPVNFSEAYDLLKFDQGEEVIGISLKENGGALITSNNNIILWGPTMQRGWDFRFGDSVRVYDLDNLKLDKDEYISRINLDYNRIYYISSLGRVFLSGHDFIDPPGPSSYVIIPNDSPRDMEIQLNNTMSIWTPNIVFYYNEYFYYLPRDVQNMDSYEWKRVDIPHYSMTKKVRRNQEYNVYETFNLDESEYQLVDTQKDNNSHKYVFRKIEK
jgi:uncharacterized repeat protein (TIGR02543 family)